MSTSSRSINDILEELHFTREEKLAIKRSIICTKLEQQDDENDAKEDIYRIIKELMQNEI